MSLIACDIAMSCDIFTLREPTWLIGGSPIVNDTSRQFVDWVNVTSQRYWRRAESFSSRGHTSSNSQHCDY